MDISKELLTKMPIEILFTLSLEKKRIIELPTLSTNYVYPLGTCSQP